MYVQSTHELWSIATFDEHSIYVNIIVIFQFIHLVFGFSKFNSSNNQQLGQLVFVGQTQKSCETVFIDFTLIHEDFAWSWYLFERGISGITTGFVSKLPKDLNLYLLFCCLGNYETTVEGTVFQFWMMFFKFSNCMG